MWSDLPGFSQVGLHSELNWEWVHLVDMVQMWPEQQAVPFSILHVACIAHRQRECGLVSSHDVFYLWFITTSVPY